MIEHAIKKTVPQGPEKICVQMQKISTRAVNRIYPIEDKGV
jgi:hypothetical protein